MSDQPNGANGSADGGPVGSGRMRVRVPAGSSTQDTLVNFAARYGIGAQNLLSQSTYQFYPVTRLQQLMEWAYRGNWVVGAAIDAIADDMTREGVTLNSDMDPDQVEQLDTAMQHLGIWQSLNNTIKWARLYGGAIAVMMIDGQDPATELRPETVPKDAFKGFLVLDRWLLQPSYNDLVGDLGPDYGMPRFYHVVATGPFLPTITVHYSRVLRFDGIELPFRQRIAENGWGMSVLERLWEVLQGFNSGTVGAAQLLFKAYLRTYKVKDYRKIIAAGGPLKDKFWESMEFMRLFQSNEGLTVVDMEDEFETQSYNFDGLSEVLMFLGQCLAGATGTPLVRLFGQSPSGLSATGESDIRNYIDMIRTRQERDLRRPLTRMFEVLSYSVLGSELPDTFNFDFVSLRQLDEFEKSEIAQRDADTINMVHQGGIITTATAMKELKQSSITTGRFTNIEDKDIDAAEEEAPDPWEQPEMGMPGMGGGQKPGMPGPQKPPGLAMKMPVAKPPGEPNETTAEK